MKSLSFLSRFPRDNKLKRLSLRNITNSFGSSSSVFLHFSHLKELDVASCAQLNLSSTNASHLSFHPQMEKLALDDLNVAQFDLAHFFFLTEINLSSNRLRFIDTLRNPKLEALNLSHNLLTSFNMLTDIYYSDRFTLDLSFNRLENVHFVSTISQEPFGFRIAKLNDNNLTMIDSALAEVLLSSRQLDLSGNRLSRISKEYTKSWDCESVNLRNNSLEIITSHMFRSSNHISLLQSLDLSQNRIKRVEEVAFLDFYNLAYFKSELQSTHGNS